MVDQASYDQALSDADMALLEIQASVAGPMPEATWLSIARNAVNRLKMVPAVPPPTMGATMSPAEEARLSALEAHVSELTGVVSAIKGALEGANPTVQAAMETVPPVPEPPKGA